jgi:hypothetical protein
LKILDHDGNFGDKQRGRYDRTLLRPGTAALRLRAPRALWSAATGRRFFAKARRAQVPRKLGDRSPSFWNDNHHRVFPYDHREMSNQVQPSHTRSIKLNFF